MKKNKFYISFFLNIHFLSNKLKFAAKILNTFMFSLFSLKIRKIISFLYQKIRVVTINRIVEHGSSKTDKKDITIRPPYISKHSSHTTTCTR